MAVPYDSDEAFLRLVVPYIGQAVAEGRYVLVVTTAHNLDLVIEALGQDARLIDVRLSSEWYLHPHRTLAAYLEYIRGRSSLVVGEPTWDGRSEREIREWIRYESIANAALGDDDCVALCLYDLRELPVTVRDSLDLTHPVRLAEGGERRSESYVDPRELVLEGDLEPLPEPDGEVRTADFSAGELKRLRQTVSDFARGAGMERSLIASLVLSVSEIAANAVEHGAGYGTVAMWSSGSRLVCEVSDPGGGGWDDPLPGHLPPEPESPRGYGLWISRQLCDLVEMRTTQGTLRVRLHMGLGA